MRFFLVFWYGSEARLALHRAGEQRFFRLTIDPASFSSFDYRTFNTPNAAPFSRTADTVIGPYSTVTGSVVISGASSNNDSAVVRINTGLVLWDTHVFIVATENAGNSVHQDLLVKPVVF